jgi:hypothetical protein
MDTVFPTPMRDMYYDRQKGVMWSTEGGGFDDRAGVFAIIKLLQRGYRPTILLTLDEELGGLGATALTEDYPARFAEYKYFIELDRQGHNDCVFYRCGNKDFINYVESFGFKLNYGTFTDISIVCPKWGIAGVNLSIGYVNEHTYSEILHVDWLMETVQRVSKMLESVETAPFFPFIESLEVFGVNTEECLCSKCRKPFIEYDLYDVITKDLTTKQYCIDCLVRNVSWCEACSEPFEVTKHNANARFCYKCQEAMTNGKD